MFQVCVRCKTTGKPSAGQNYTCAAVSSNCRGSLISAQTCRSREHNRQAEKVRPRQFAVPQRRLSSVVQNPILLYKKSARDVTQAPRNGSKGIIRGPKRLKKMLPFFARQPDFAFRLAVLAKSLPQHSWQEQVELGTTHDSFGHRELRSPT